MEVSISSMYLPKLISTSPIDGYFTLKFDQTNTCLYLAPKAVEKVERLRMYIDSSNLSTDSSIYFCPSGCYPELFLATFGIVAENKTVKEALTPLQKQDPRIFELLRKNLLIFYPAKCLDISKSLLTQLSAMDLQDAYAILNASEKESSYAKVLAAKRIKSSIYFATEEKYYACLDLKEQKKVMLSPYGLLQASKYIDHSNALIRTEARKAHRLLETYQKKITQALESTGIDISNEQLMQYIIGPKNFLLSHYGIVLSADAAGKAASFCYAPIFQDTCATEQGIDLVDTNGFTFSFENISSPRDLEREIRSKLLRSMGLEEDYDTYHKFLSKLGLEEDSEAARKLYAKIEAAPSLFYDRSNDMYCSKGFFPRRLILQSCDKNLMEDTSIPLSPHSSNVKNYVDAVSDLKQRKKTIYFSNFEKAQAWLSAHPDPQDFKKYKISPWALQQASMHFNLENTHLHPEIQLAALKADTILKNYVKRIRNTLKRSGSNMDEGLLEYITGPKDFIFSRFGIVPKDTPCRNDYPFCFIPGVINTCVDRKGLHMADHVSLGYHLDNTNPEALKQEILADIAHITNNNPQFSFD